MVSCTIDPLLGSEGIKLDSVTDSAIHVALAASRGLPACPNMLQMRIHGAAQRPLKIHARFEYPEPRGMLDEYHHSATKDFVGFIPLNWEQPTNGRSNVLIVPATGWDDFFISMQYPLPSRQLEDLYERWADEPGVTVESIGKSVYGRDLTRVRVGPPSGNFMESNLSWHCIANFHPGEGNARWRMVGMLEWLLSAEGSACRNQIAADFHFLLSPDGVANGWRRVQADGIDMNRCFFPKEADRSAQPIEARHFQHHIEIELAKSYRSKALWCMHTWPGKMEILFDGLASDITGKDRFIEGFNSCIDSLDTDKLIKPAVLRESPGGETTWNGGAHRLHGITSVLVEGGGDMIPLHQHRQGGANLMQTIARLWA